MAEHSPSIDILIRRLGHSFTDTSLVDLALTHRSVGAKNNERLEFLGDSIVNYLMAEALFKQFPDCREGDLSRMRAQLVKGKTLAEIALEFELGDFLRLGPGEMKSGGHRRESILADAVEALIGAMYLDGGMDVCREHVGRWYQSRLASMTVQGTVKDAKTRLQELLQSRKQSLPRYELVTTTGSDHQQQFTVECQIEHLQQGFQGVASNRREAEQIAAKAAFELLQHRK
ncbi:ribonuclease III [Oceanicoccus sagamiensis]|uniref:ribonuclease III n=1 Tax=Oceanicoccus sagamiensis TaxID=716816 RepID=UPI001981C961|nr:ribonuclease III [Oceanicoccus sagamiensis]